MKAASTRESADEREFAEALKSALRLDPSFRPGVPSVIFNLLMGRTAGWLANGSSAEALPLISLGALKRALTKASTLPATKRSASDNVRKKKQVADKVSAALTAIGKRLRSSPAARTIEGGGEALLLQVEVDVFGKRLVVELAGPLQKHRHGLGFPDDYRVGFLARLIPASSLRTSADRTNTSVRLAGVSRPVFDIADVADELAARLPRLTLRTPRQLPQPPRDFIGRDDDMSEILNIVTTGQTAIIGLQGPDGIGKTALALAAAHRLSDHYRACLFIDLQGAGEQSLSPADVMRHVVRAFRPRDVATDSIDELRGLYHSVLQEVPTLLLFDNVRDAVQLHPLLPPRQTLVILTSATQFTFPSMWRKQVVPLETQAARDLLLRIVPRAAGMAEDIAQLCDGFPLLLRAAGSALEETPNLTPQRYAQLLSDAGVRLALLDPATERSVGSVLESVYALLPAGIQPLVDALSTFAAGFDERAAQAVWRISDDDTSEALSLLVRRSLVDYHESDQRYEMHELVRAFAETQLRPSVGRAVQRRFARFYRGELHRLSRVERGEITAALWNNILAAQRQTLLQRDTDRSARRLSISFAYEVISTDRVVRRLTPAEQRRWLEPPPGDFRSKRARRLISSNLADLAAVYGRCEDVRSCLSTLKRLTEVVVGLDDDALFSRVVTALFYVGRLRRELAEVIIGYFSAMVQQALVSVRQLCILNLLGALSAEHRLHEEAERWFRQWLITASSLPCKTDQARISMVAARSEILSRLANNAASEGDMQRALQCVEERLQLVQEHKLASTGDEWGDAALMHARFGDFGRASEAYRTRLDLVTDAEMSAEVLAEEANAWFDLAHESDTPPDEKIQFQSRAYDLLRLAVSLPSNTSNRYEKAAAFFALGKAYLHDGKHTDAADNFRKAVYGFAHTGNSEAQIRSLICLSLALLHFNRFDTTAFREGFSARAEALMLLEAGGDQRAQRVRESLEKWRKFESEGQHPFLD